VDDLGQFKAVHGARHLDVSNHSQHIGAGLQDRDRLISIDMT
jgi:hypothetical protein